MTETYKETYVEELLDTLLDTGVTSTVVVYNDDVNTFDWVIDCLMDLCDHPFQQAEQLSLLIHFKGKATVKTGSVDFIKAIKDALIERGLQAVIEDFKAK